MAQKKLDVIIEARNMTRAGFEKAEQESRRFRQRTQQQDLGFAKSVTESLAKVYAAAGSVEMAFRGVSAITAIWRGDFEALELALKRLPFGFGTVASAFYEMREELSGAKKIQEEMEASWKRFQQVQGARGVVKAQAATMGEQIRTLRQELYVLTYEGAERQIDRAGVALDSQIENLERKRRGALKAAAALMRVDENDPRLIGEFGRAQAKIESEHRKARSLAIAIAEKKVGEIRQKEEARRAQAAEKLAEDARRQQKEADEQARARRHELEDIESELLQGRMRRHKQYLQAELEQIRHFYQRRIELAEDADIKEGLGRLQKQQEEQARAIFFSRKKKGYQPAGVAATPVSRFFDDIAASFRARGQPEQRQARLAERTAENTAKTAGAVEQLVDLARRGGASGVTGHVLGV
ncbi:MAG: hypothetical protein KAY37_01045 [Phycisphaerae bacterium]|nr:hypothetical protein [Phycisphaerae bacterium]